MSKKKKTNKKNYYFDEESFQKMLQEYKDITEVDDEKRVIKTDKQLEEKIIKEVKKIVNAIIMVHRYYVFEDYDDLMQHALNACYKSFLKFDESKGTAYNYYSIISKISLLNYTTRKKKHRNHQDIDEYHNLEHREIPNYELFFEDLEYTLLNIIDENYVGKKREEYIKVAAVIIDYLKKTQKFVSKSDLYAWGRSLGIKNNQIRQFLKEISTYKEDIFEGVK